MSVSLLIEYTNSGEKNALFPFATQQSFIKYIIPLSNKLNLKWIRLFETGIPLVREDLPFVIMELRILQANVSINSLINRITTIINELEKIIDDDKDEFKIFIG